jgi:hypothetical protein
LGFPTGWSFTTHKESFGAINHALAANFLAPLSGTTKKKKLPRQLGTIMHICEAGCQTQFILNELYMFTSGLLCVVYKKRTF